MIDRRFAVMVSSEKPNDTTIGNSAMLFDHPLDDGHEQICFHQDRRTGLKCIIAIHNTRLGPGGGGVRFWRYASDAEALSDALRLSRAMTYKMAIAGLPLGGAKAVIIGDPERHKTPELMRAFGRFVDRLSGRYICGEDVGTTPVDMAEIHTMTKHVRGLEGRSGDTSPSTGRGVFRAIQAAVFERTGSRDLNGVHVAVQGAGNVARYLCRHLRVAGARMTIADINRDKARILAAEVESEAVEPDQIISQNADVFAPCALGGVIDAGALPSMRAGIVCGGANNPLADESLASDMAARGILFVPDYVANAGGAMSAGREGPWFDPEEVREAVDGIYDTCLEIFSIAKAKCITPTDAAERMAARILDKAKATTTRTVVGPSRS